MNARIFGAAALGVVSGLGLFALLGSGAAAQESQPAAEATQPPATPSLDTVVAVVDGKKLTRADVIASAQSLPAQYQQNLEAIFPALIDRLVDLTLVGAEARKRNLQDDPEVKAELARASDQVMQEAMIRRHLQEEMTEDAIKSRYDKFVAALPPQTEVRARHILVESEGEAKSIIAELEGGADFAELAKSKSTDPSAKENGGDLGYFVAGQMVEDKRPKQPPTLEAARGQIEQILSNELVTAYVEELRGTATIEKFNPDGTPITDQSAGEPSEQQQ